MRTQQILNILSNRLVEFVIVVDGNLRAYKLFNEEVCCFVAFLHAY